MLGLKNGQLSIPQLKQARHLLFQCLEARFQRHIFCSQAIDLFLSLLADTVWALDDRDLDLSAFGLFLIRCLKLQFGFIRFDKLFSLTV